MLVEQNEYVFSRFALLKQRARERLLLEAQQLQSHLLQHPVLIPRVFLAVEYLLDDELDLLRDLSVLNNRAVAELRVLRGLLLQGLLLDLDVIYQFEE